MNSTLKGLAIIAAAMMAVGALLTGVGFVSGGNQPIHLDRSGFHVGDEKNSGKLEHFSQNTEKFHSIDVDLDTFDVEMIPGDKYAVEGSFLKADGQPDVKVENGVLKVRSKNSGVKIDLNMPGLLKADNKPVLKIYYPKDTKFEAVAIKCDSSDLAYDNLAADRLELTLDFGKLDLTNVSAENVTVSMDSGDCALSGIKASEKLDVSNDMGKITLDGIEVKNLNVKANSGDVTLTNVAVDSGDLTVDMGKLTGKSLQTKGLKASADSGDISLEGTLLGLTDITCDMGSVTVSPGGSKDLYNYELKADMGSVSVGGDKASGSLSSSNSGAKNTVKISADMGSINVNFD